MLQKLLSKPELLGRAHITKSLGCFALSPLRAHRRCFHRDGEMLVTGSD